jgi:5-methyltetrahydrofolate--homocysteine methyltransferase
MMGAGKVAKSEILGKIRDSLVNLDLERLQHGCREALDAGIPAIAIVDEGMREGMRIVGEKFEAMEYFLCELVMAGEIMEAALKILEPYLKLKKAKSTGKVIIGTVKGDMHYIGKHIVIALLKSAGFDVVDLGEDISPEEFVESVKKEKPDIVGMSGLITPSLPHMADTIKALEKGGLRGKVRVIIGGAPTTEEYANMIGADACAKNAADGVTICKNWMVVTDEH